MEMLYQQFIFRRSHVLHKHIKKNSKKKVLFTKIFLLKLT